MATEKRFARILIAEDDEMFRAILGQILSDAGYEIMQVDSGRSAIHLLELSAFGAVISDIRMKGGDGFELLGFIRSKFPDLPVLLMTGFAEIERTLEAYSLGVHRFISKPFNKNEILAIVEEMIRDPKEAREAEEEDLDEQFAKLGINDFVSGKEIKYDVYVRLSAAKYIKIAHQGEDLARDRIDAYVAKGIAHLYLRKEDFLSYVGMNLRIAPLVKSSSKIEKDRKLLFMKHTSEVIMEQIYFSGVDKPLFDASKTIVETTVDLCTEDKDQLLLLNALNSHSDYLYAHALGVSVISVLIARKMKWTSPGTLARLAMSGLYHDIGKKELPRELLDTPRRDLSPKEIAQYETHVVRGMEILGQLQSMPGDVLQVALQHHEDCMGLGFPRRLTRRHIHPMARVVAVANAFCNLTIKNPNSKGIPAKDAIQKMLAHFPGRLDPDPLVGLMATFGMDATGISFKN